MYRIAAYITAYEDAAAVRRCLEAMQNQSYPIEKIFIVDNSVNCLGENTNKIIWEHHPENLGIAAGLNLGIAWATQENYDFLWTFDQDSEPHPDALAILLETSEKLLNLGIVACLPIDRSSGYQLHGLVFQGYRFRQVSAMSDYYECDIVITSGSLVAVEAVKNIPQIDSNLFIDAVDWDLCLKLKKYGYKIYLEPRAVLDHCYGASYQVIIPWINKQVTLSDYSPLRYYYITRNQTFIETRYAQEQGVGVFTVLSRLINMFKKLLKIVIFKREQMLVKIYAVLKGSLAGLRGDLRKQWFR
jgi:rhamnosyltransferase